MITVQDIIDKVEGLRHDPVRSPGEAKYNKAIADVLKNIHSLIIDEKLRVARRWDDILVYIKKKEKKGVPLTSRRKAK